MLIYFQQRLIVWLFSSMLGPVAVQSQMPCGIGSASWSEVSNCAQPPLAFVAGAFMLYMDEVEYWPKYENKYKSFNKCISLEDEKSQVPKFGGEKVGPFHRGITYL